MRLTELKGIGEKRVAHLYKMDVYSVEDLLSVVPYSYHDMTRQKQIAELVNGESALLTVTITTTLSVRYIRKNRNMASCKCRDDSALAELIWFNQPYRAKNIEKNRTYTVFGKIQIKNDRIFVLNPIYEPAQAGKLNGIIPVYRLPAKSTISQKLMRDMIKQAITLLNSQTIDLLPVAFRSEYKLAERNFAMENIHFPLSFDALQKAKRRLAFEDLLLFLLAVQEHKAAIVKQECTPYILNGEIEMQFASNIPYPLTNAQINCIKDIKNDLISGKVMNRLIQGDVGSGKTVLAFYAIFAAVKNGGQAVLMAPTDVLAKQHFTGFTKLFPDIETIHLHGGMQKKERDAALFGIWNGNITVIIGTHAILEKDVEFQNLSLAVTDEQHRFGVSHRAVLGGKGQAVHTLVMSATPIPRTLTLILYSDLSLSVLNELPAGRKKIGTHIVPPEKQEDLFAYIGKCAMEGKQSYIVCPLIEESDEVPCPSAEEMYKKLKKGALKEVPTSLLHGKLKPLDKDAIMQAFIQGQTKVLISTTVIEVGINVPNAVNMVIVGADRFGLASLHQLRGRVGRGQEQSFCFLLTDTQSASALKRLAVLTATNDGFVIAEKDLQLRGPGDYLGTRQSGVPSTRYAQMLSDMPLLEEVQKALDILLNTPDYFDAVKIIKDKIKTDYNNVRDIVYN